MQLHFDMHVQNYCQHIDVSYNNKRKIAEGQVEKKLSTPLLEKQKTT